MNHLPTCLVAICFLTGSLLVIPGLANTDTTPATDTPPATALAFGMEAAAVSGQTGAGVKPDYGTFWIGPWTLSSGWGGPDKSLAAMNAAGVTPAVHFYYWGDDISPSCVENGCWSDLHNAQKTRAGWQQLAGQMVDHLNSQMGGKPVVIFMESEFNKGGIETYEPFDGYMANMAEFIHAGYPNAQIVLGFGNWGSHHWGNFDRAAAASDLIGIQGMRGSTRDSLSHYQDLYESTLASAQYVQDLFGKPVFIQDLALSSYPEPAYVAHQEAELKQFFDNLGPLKEAGVEALVYRSWTDAPNMDLKNYYGEAERHWGLHKAYSGGVKPAGEIWIAGVKAERADPAPGGAGSSTPAPSEPLGATFEPSKNNNNWWVEVKVSSSSSIAKVAASHDGKPFVQLSKTNWGAWAKSFSAPAGGEMTYRATDSQGRTASETFAWLPAPVNQAPVAKLSATTSGLQVTVDASGSADPDGDSLSYAIAFGDGQTASVAKATHTYAAAGTYTITLTVHDGKASGTASQSVTMVQPNRAPVAAFSATTKDLVVNVDASASSDPDGDALSYKFDFGDGATATTAKATHTYTAPGDYTVRLTVHDGKASGTASQSVTMVQPNRAPVAAFSATTKDLVVNVDASASSDPDGDALSYKFDFGDGATATKAKASHTYVAAGTYTVTLVVSDGVRSSTAHKTLVVSAPAPLTAAFEPSKNNNNWWVDVKVSSGSTIVKVEASHDGKPFVQLSKTSWGTWAKSFHAPAGGEMTYRATDSNGRTASETFAWLSAPTPKFTATFSPRAVGNDWWLETAVSGSQPIAKIEASLNGGAWTKLPLTSWGTYAKSMHAPDGTQVVFRATATDGLTATSGTYRWT